MLVKCGFKGPLCIPQISLFHQGRSIMMSKYKSLRKKEQASFSTQAKGNGVCSLVTASGLQSNHSGLMRLTCNGSAATGDAHSEDRKENTHAQESSHSPEAPGHPPLLSFKLHAKNSSGKYLTNPAQPSHFIQEKTDAQD